MNKEQVIEEGNKIIAEFMGYDFSALSISYEYFDRNGTLEWETRYRKPTVDDLEYHSSFDWLMPVVDKIESIDSCTYEVMLKYAIAFVCDKGLHGNPPVVRAIGSTRIETAYNLVVKFIQWYNQQTPTP